MLKAGEAPHGHWEHVPAVPLRGRIMEMKELLDAMVAVGEITQEQADRSLVGYYESQKLKLETKRQSLIEKQKRIEDMLENGIFGGITYDELPK